MLEHITEFEKVRNSHDNLIIQTYLDSLMKYMPASVSGLIFDDTSHYMDRYVNNMYECSYLDETETLKLRNNILETFNETTFTVIGSQKMLGNGMKHPIFCLPVFLNRYSNEQVLINALCDHEGYHATVLQQGLKLPHGIIVTSSNVHEFKPEFLNIMEEYLARTNQLERFDERKIEDIEARNNIDSARQEQLQKLIKSYPGQSIYL
jgi:hypothetical protein